MTVAPLALPRLQLFDANGDPLAFGFLDTFAGGTLTPLGSFADAAGAVANTNPIALDTGGYADVFLTIGVAYKLRVRNAAGEILSTVDNVILNPQATPQAIAGYEATVTQSNLTTDPGEPGSENLATTEAGMWERIKFILGEMKGVAWRQTYTSRRATGSLQFSISGPVKVHGSIQFVSPDGTWQATGTTLALYRLHIPDGWSTGTDFFFHLLRHSSSASGTSRMTAQIVRFRDGIGGTTLASADIDFIPGDTNTHDIVLQVTGGALAPNDIISILITRLGDDAADTNTLNVASDGFWFVYTGIPPSNGTWQPSGTTVATYSFQVPDGYQAGTNILLSFFRRSVTGSGTARMTVIINRIRDNTAISQLVAQDLNFIPGNTLSHQTDVIASGSFAVGDVIQVLITRLGDDAADTNTGNVLPDGHWFTYEGVASR